MSTLNRFFVICKDFNGLVFCDGEIRVILDVHYNGGAFSAVEWFLEHPVGD